jgi:hypothetical protein
LPNFAACSRRQTFSIAPPRSSPSGAKPQKPHGAGVAAVGFRVGACAAARALRPLPKIVATISFQKSKFALW